MSFHVSSTPCIAGALSACRMRNYDHYGQATPHSRQSHYPSDPCWSLIPHNVATISSKKLPSAFTQFPVVVTYGRPGHHAQGLGMPRIGIDLGELLGDRGGAQHGSSPTPLSCAATSGMAYRCLGQHTLTTVSAVVHEY